MCKVYGYARVSTKSQKLQRQIDNIKQYDANAIIYEEKYTGAKFDGRVKFEELLRKVKKGDTIVFDSVSRMSRDAEKGIEVYFDLVEMGVNLVFLKELHINTDVYAASKSQSIELTGNEIADPYIEATNKVLKILAKKQIRIAFDQAEKEVKDIRKRVKEGIEKSDKKQGIKQGTKLTTNKSIAMKEKMKRQLKDFGGTETDKQFMTDNAIARNTFYKYKKELIEEMQKGE